MILYLFIEQNRLFNWHISELGSKLKIKKLIFLYKFLKLPHFDQDFINVQFIFKHLFTPLNSSWSFWFVAATAIMIHEKLWKACERCLHIVQLVNWQILKQAVVVGYNEKCEELNDNVKEAAHVAYEIQITINRLLMRNHKIW